MSSGNIKHYLGGGPAASRPATLDLSAGAIGWWLSEDTGELSVWDGSAWREMMSPEDESPATYTASTIGSLDDKVVRMNTGAASTYTVPSNAAVAYPIGKVIELWQMGAGSVTLVAADGVSIRVRSGLTLTLNGRYAGVSLRKMAANEWYVVGDLEATP